MPFIMNSLETPVNTQAHGKWFKWAPRQIKEIQNVDLSMFLEQNRGEEGLISIPDHVMELDKNSEEYKAAIEEKRREGVQKRINKLDFIIRNLEQSLRYDLEKANIKADPFTFASKGELAAYKERSTLLEFERKNTTNIGDEIRKLKAQMEEGAVSGSGSSTQSGANNPGYTHASESTQGRK